MARGRLIGRRALTLLTAVLGVCSIVLAFLAPGVEDTEVDLNDGGVWVTNAKRRLVAHVNVPARLMDAGLHANSSSFDVFQEGEDVKLIDAEVGTLTNVDVSTATLGSSVDYAGFTVEVAGNTVALTDATKGSVWIQDARAMAPIDVEQAEADVVDMPGAVAAVGVDGGVHVVSAKAGKVVSVSPRGSLEDRVETALAGVDADSHLQVAAVGDKVVVFDQDEMVLHLPGGNTQKVEGESLSVVLQDSGPRADFVLLASSDALVTVPLAGGEAVVVAAPAKGGVPTRPVLHQGCAYGAWSVSGAFVRDCAGEEHDKALTVESLVSAESAVFRTNRDVIVLNEVKQGGLWLPDADMVLIDNWDQIESKLESDERSEEDAPEEDSTSLLPNRSEENTAPEAVEDEFGVRAGRVTILPVLVNDSDPDGDFMTAKPLTQPSIGEVTVAREGAALQVNVPAGATGAGSFEYEVSDGRGGTAKAKVSLNIRGEEVNEAPRQLSVPSVSLGPGRSATVNGLANWIDPDGDPFYLVEAIAPTGIVARSSESGRVEIREAGHGSGKDTVTLVVSDGRDEGEGVINVLVKDAGNEAPVANADHVVVREGASAVISPLANDSDPNGDPLRLVQVDQAPTGITVVSDGTAGTVTIEGQKVGTYYVSYVITDGPLTSTSFIRIDVVADDASLPPSAEDDLGVLPEGEQVLVDLLANDADPTGGVLTVQKVEVPAGSPLVVALINHQLVRVTSPRGMNGPATFTYTVSNGAATATATVTILPRAAHVQASPPELADDTLVVRAGDVASVAVLDNDRSPAGLKMTVANELQHEIDAELGTVFISNNVVRVRGGSRAGSGRIIYTVHDTLGNVASATVNLTVVAKDEGTNTPPRPKDITARALAGRTISIQVPLTGIDPEGDSTSLVGLASAPKMGIAKQVGSTFEYTPAADAKGTDTFTYLVEDKLGRQAAGRIRVGVAPSAGVNQAPVALPDLVRVRPGTKVAVAVMTNDIDPDGDDLRLVADSLTSQVEGMAVTERAGRLVVTAPQTEGSHVISYRIEDGNGGSAEGICTIAVTKNAPLQAPIARDDELTLEEVQAATTPTVTVDVLANDEDPDGDIAEVKLSSPDTGVEVAGGQLAVPIKPEAQTLIYTVTDAAGLSASAVVSVPGKEVVRPVLDATTLPIKAKAAQVKEININDHITARAGRKVILTSEAKVSAGVGWDGSPLVKDRTTLTFKSTEAFSGPTAVTIEVTDGADLNDSTGVVTTLTLPIEVEPIDNRPPTLTPTGLEVAPGEDAVVAEMAPWVKDPDGDDPAGMKYAIVSEVPAGLSARVDGSTLSVSAETQTARGTTATLTIEVTDQEGAKATGQVPVTVVSSSRPLIQTSQAELTLNAGESKSIDVTQYATNPFADRGPLTVSGAPTVSEGGSATVSGTELSIAANTGFNGSFTVTYRLQDATKDPSREVQGVVTVTVRDKPQAPQNVVAISNSAATANISWTAGAANGAAITGFTVTDHTQGDSKECGLVTTCLFEGRKNGIDHTFSVTATNEVGISEASNQATVNIDIEPEQPSAPTVTVDDQALTATWVAPHNEGSEITEYEVLLSPGGPVTVPASQLSYSFTGLANGAGYKVSVRAKNAKGWSALSTESLEAVPYGAPGAPEGFTAQTGQLGEAESDAAVVNLSWAPAHPNGRAVEYYTVTGGGVTKEVPGESTSTALEGVGYSDGQVTFKITATNDRAKADVRTSGESTASVWVLGRPHAPAGGTVTATGNNNEASLRVNNSPAGRGWNPGQLSYQWRTDGIDWLPVKNKVWSNALVNGRDMPIYLRAVGEKGGVTAYSSETRIGTVSAFGPPTSPSVTCSGGTGNVHCSWGGGYDNGRPTKYVQSDAGSNGNAGADGSQNFAAAEGEGKRLCLTAVQSSSELGERRAEAKCASANARTYAREYTTSKGGFAGNPYYGVNNAYFLRLNLSNWPPNSWVKCSGDLSSNVVDKSHKGHYYKTVQVNGNGSFSEDVRWDGHKNTRLIGDGEGDDAIDFGTFFSNFKCEQQ